MNKELYIYEKAVKAVYKNFNHVSAAGMSGNEVFFEDANGLEVMTAVVHRLVVAIYIKDIVKYVTVNELT